MSKIFVGQGNVGGGKVGENQLLGSVQYNKC